VDLGPFRVPEFTGTDEYQRGQPQGATAHERPLVGIDRTHQIADTLGIGDSRVVSLSGDSQGTAQVGGRVLGRPASYDRVVKDLGAGLLGASGRVDRSALL